MSSDPIQLPHDEALRRAEESVDRLLAERNDRWYPTAHIAARAGWINDPNGLAFFDGRYQVYFQHHPYSAEWGNIHWGHVTSTDMVTWRREPIAMAPSITADRDGVFSGSGIVRDDGSLAVLYTGHRFRNGVNEDEGNLQVQCLATSEDGLTFTKHGIVIDCPDGYVHFRDPKVWKQDDGLWYLVVGTSVDGRGEVWLYRSTDPALERWEFDRVLYRDPDKGVFMLECPDFFPLGGHWVLGFSPMGTTPHGYVERNGNNAVYVVGDWEPGGDFRNVSAHHPGDWGHNYYAPQSFEAPDGRRILYGWMGSFTSPEPTREADNWCGQFTAPRELTLGSDGLVRTTPIREYASLREEEGAIELGPFDLGINCERVLLEDANSATGGAVEIHVDVDLSRSTSERTSLVVHATADGGGTLVAYDDQSGMIVLDRRTSGAGDRGYRAMPAAPGSRHLQLRVIVDRGSVEVYDEVSGQVMSSVVFPSEGARAVVLQTESGTAAVESVSVHRLRSIWDEPDRP